MDVPESMPGDWQNALVRAQGTAFYVREGLLATQFAALAGCHPNTVWKFARRGLAAFQERFGAGCQLAWVPPSGELRVTFAGPLNPLADEPPVSGALRAPAFYEHLQLQGAMSVLYRYHERGHAWFRAKFPGWDFLELPRPGTDKVVRWYVPVVAVEEQADVLPEDELTVVQFAQLKGLKTAPYLKACCRSGGVKKFEARFPGWSFRWEGSDLVFFRVGTEVPQLNLAQFARHMGKSRSCVSQSLKRGQFEERFPGWRAENFVPPGAKFGRWCISPIPDQQDLLPSGDAAIDPEPEESWLVKMVRAHSEVVQHFEGIDSVEFGRLVGCSGGWVTEVIRRGGEAAFKETFGAGCSFKKVASPHRPFRYQFSFMGRVHPKALVVPGVQLLTEEDFAWEQGCSMKEVQAILAQGVAAVQAKFPAWEWLELVAPLWPGQSVRLFIKRIC